MGGPQKRERQRFSAIEQAAGAVRYTHELLEAHGEIEVVGDVMRAGSHILNESTELVDAVKVKYGFGCTIFRGNVRIATTAVAAGGRERAIGTSTNEKITQMVLRMGARFWGVTRTIGKEWVIVYEPLRASSGRIVGMVACYQELFEYLDDLSRLDGTPEGVLLHGEDGRILDLNLSACDMLGINRGVALQSFLQSFTVGELPAGKELLWPDTNAPVAMESRWRRPDGHEFPVELSLERSPDNPSVVVTIARDVTDRFEARERLRELNTQLTALNHGLEERVTLRTQELVGANERLRHEMETRSRLEEKLKQVHKLEAVSLLAAGIGHEINNPLSYMMTNLHLAGDELDQLEEHYSQESISELREMIGDASAGAEHIKQIVLDIRNFSRQEMPKMVPVALDEALDLAIKLVGPVVRDHLRVVREFAPNLPLVGGDSSQLTQVFENLLINASHACSGIKGGEARIQARVSSSGMVQVIVSDNGCGMTRNDVLRAFDPFFTTKQVGSGTGLGLSICHGLITAMGGKISIESVENAGTTISIFLKPVTEVTRSSIPKKAEVARSPGTSVLVIDDEPLLLRGLAKSLRSLGLQVTTASSGREGLLLYQRDDFALVLCDLMMPNFTGQDFYRELETMGSGHAEKVVVVTGGAFTEDTKRFLDRPDVDSLTKPFTLDELEQIVRKHMPGKQKQH